MNDTERTLGDYLLETKPRDVGTAAPPTYRHDADNFVVATAMAWGEDPEAVLREFHANTALARLARKLAGVNVAEESRDVATYYVVQSLRQQGLKGDPLYREAARQINDERDALGRPLRNVGAHNPIAGTRGTDSIRTMEKRGRRKLRSQVSRLVGMFIP